MFLNYSSSIGTRFNILIINSGVSGKENKYHENYDNHFIIPLLTCIRGFITMEAYCVKCKSKREMKDEKKVTMKNGKPATQGICTVCGTKMFKIGK